MPEKNIGAPEILSSAEKKPVFRKSSIGFMQFVKLYRDCSPVSEAEGRQEVALGPMCPEAGVQACELTPASGCTRPRFPRRDGVTSVVETAVGMVSPLPLTRPSVLCAGSPFLV